MMTVRTSVAIPRTFISAHSQFAKIQTDRLDNSPHLARQRRVIRCAVRNCALQDLRLASSIEETLPSERILNGETSAVSTCLSSMGTLRALYQDWLSRTLITPLIARYLLASFVLGYQDLNRSRLGGRSYQLSNSQQRRVYIYVKELNLWFVIHRPNFNRWKAFITPDTNLST